MARRPPRLRVLAIALALALAGGGVFWQIDRGEPTPARGSPGFTVDHAPETTTVSAGQRLPEGRDDFAAAFRAGLRNFQNGDAHAAARAFEKAVSIRPHEVQARVNLGFAYIEMDRPAEAGTLFDAALEIAPMTANAYYGLAEAHEARGDLAGAIGAMRTFLHLADAEDPFRRRAMAALWEWQEITGSRPEAGVAAALATTPAPERGPDGAGATTGVAILDAPLETLDGAPTTLARHRGKVIVLNVWATWCGPCRVELPSLERLSAALAPDDFVVIGVSMDKERFLTAEYLRELGVDFTSYWDETGRLTGELLGARAIPLTLVLSPTGQVIATHEGARDWSRPDVVAAIRQVADRTAPIDTRVVRLREGLQ